MSRGSATRGTEALGRGPLLSRRDYLRILVTLSGGVVLGTAAVAAGVLRRHGRGDGPATLVARDLAPGEAATFAFPGGDDPAIAVRLPDGSLVGYSSVCTHLQCPVLWRAEAGRLECPCHKGIFEATSGRPLAGPPTRPLPRIRLEEGGDGIYAVEMMG